MSQQSLTISGIGLCTSMGGYKDACAAYRAGLNRFSAHDDLQLMFTGDEEPSPLTIAPAEGGLFGYKDTGRTIKLFQKAYLDLIDNINNPLPENLTILMALPDPADREIEVEVAWDAPRDQRLQTYLDSFISTMFDQINPAFNDVALQTVFGDRASFARILQKATHLLENGDSQDCLLMIADSMIGDADLELQLECEMLITGDNPVGYIPGEGAAMLLLSRAGNQNIAVKIQVEMDASTIDFDDEDSDTELWQGRKLFDLYKKILPETMQQFPELIYDLNGQENRAIEFSQLQLMLKSCYPDIAFPQEQLPALSFGELGAMMGPIALATILASVERGYARQRNFLINLSEDSGKRAVILILL